MSIIGISTACGDIRTPPAAGSSDPFLDMDADTLFRLRADTGVTKTGNDVTQWEDTLSSATAAFVTYGNDPLFEADGWDTGVDQIDFDAWTDAHAMRIASFSASGGTYTFIAVVNNVTIRTNSYAFDSNQSFIAAMESALGTDALGHFDGAHKAANNSTATTGKQWLMWEFDGSTPEANIYKNGTLVAGCPLTYTSKSFSGPIALFRRSNGSGGWADVKCAEVILLDKLLSAGEKTDVATYMSDRYGL